MDTLTITLVPKDDSGKERIALFAAKHKDGMPFGGSTKLNEDGTATFVWKGKLVKLMGERLRSQMEKSLDKALEGKDNVTYTVDSE